ncbi:hypothetical protein NHP190003_04970 [Helicobacter sp. NHP19-003]|uniref:Lipoprotein n=1 Tax=Helicobacter gastrocanis TaxID=2849641 RepID=A0ABM7S9K2_9HELI|nr:hypothetical protein [Helicobacter sp. NHP19-003]BCZ17215.1 hypothetical protein NHP190003_04970 [Helicobacter sp. NHP19-003]
MSKKAILAGVLCGSVFLGCSVYQSSDPDATPQPPRKEKPSKQAKEEAKETHALEQQIEQLKNAVATNERKMDALDNKLKTPHPQSPKKNQNHSPNHKPTKPQPLNPRVPPYTQAGTFWWAMG